MVFAREKKSVLPPPPRYREDRLFTLVYDRLNLARLKLNRDFNPALKETGNLNWIKER